MKNILLFTLALFLHSFFAHAQIITTVAGNDSVAYCCDGDLAIHAGLYNPADVVVDTAGNLYIADGSNNRIREVSTTGIITTIAGTGTAGYNGDGIPATAAELSYPSSIALDAAGNIYICDDHNHRIRKISSSGIITTIAGTGTSGYNGDYIPATSAQITSADGVAVDGNGNVYIADIDNNRIRKIDQADGMITTIAGTGTNGFSGNGGPATTGELSDPTGIALDNAGNIFFGEHGNNCVRKINTMGVLSLIAGIDTAGYNGDNIPATSAKLNWPDGIKVDGTGNIYIADVNNNRIRKINASGIIITIAGSGIGGFSGDDGFAALAELGNPIGLALDRASNIYIADWYNNRIRYIKNTVSIDNIITEAIGVTIYPNPNSGQFTIDIRSNANEQANIIVTNLLGEKIKDFTVETNRPAIIQLDVTAGIYLLTAFDSQNITTTKIIIK